MVTLSLKTKVGVIVAVAVGVTVFVIFGDVVISRVLVMTGAGLESSSVSGVDVGVVWATSDGQTTTVMIVTNTAAVVPVAKTIAMIIAIILPVIIKTSSARTEQNECRHLLIQGTSKRTTLFERGQ